MTPEKVRMQESVCLSVPGKTFLVGEYAALEGGPSILLTTEPRFELQVTAAQPQSVSGGQASRPLAPASLDILPAPEQVNGFAPQSPAGRYLSTHAEDFAAYEFAFHDPHHGLGGLGASSAQFALLWAYRERGRQRTKGSGAERGADRERSLTSWPWTQLLRDYRAVAWSGEGAPPSGADVVAQLTGGICYFDGREGVTDRERVRSLNWKFPNLRFSLFRTGQKLATHEHLKKQSMPRSSDAHNAKGESRGSLVQDLRALSLQTHDALVRVDERAFAHAVTDYAKALAQAELVTARTLEILESVRKLSGVVAAKGCGAMGADVVLVLHTQTAAEVVQEWASQFPVGGLNSCGTRASLSECGLKFEHEVEAHV